MCGTCAGKGEKITIKNDKGRLSEEDIERMVKEAEDFAEQACPPPSPPSAQTQDGPQYLNLHRNVRHFIWSPALKFGSPALKFWRGPGLASLL